MKRKVLFFIFFLHTLYGIGLAQNKIEDGRKYLLIAKRAYTAKVMPLVKTNLRRAYRADKSNPEILYLTAAYFFNSEADFDYDMAEKFFSKFQSTMQKLEKHNGAPYIPEYERLKKLINTPPDLGGENPQIDKTVLDNLWKPIQQETPESRCREGINLIASQINLQEWDKARITLKKVEKDCAGSNQQLAGTVSLFKAQISLEDDNILDAAQQIFNASVVLPEFTSRKGQLQEKISERMDKTITQKLSSIQKNIKQQQWSQAQQSLNQIIPYLTYLSAPLKAEYHYRYAQIYIHSGQSKKARDEALKAERLGYDSEKISALLALTKKDSAIANKITAESNILKITLDKSWRSYRQKEYAKTREILTSVNNISSNPRKDQIAYYSLLSRTLIALKQFDDARNALEHLKTLGDLKGYTKEFDKWVGAFIAHWDLNIYRIHPKAIEQLENLAQNPDLKKGFRGRLYYVLAKIYKQKNNDKFNSYLALAENEHYDPIRLAALKADTSEDKPTAELADLRENTLPAGHNVNLILLGNGEIPFSIYQVNREYLGAPAVRSGRTIQTRTNRPITIQTGKNYVIEFKESGKITKENLIGAALLTTALALLLYIR